METVHTTATETPAHVATETPTHVARLIEALSLAVSDRRRVDELVTLFEYDGLVEAAGERYSVFFVLSDLALPSRDSAPRLVTL